MEVEAPVRPEGTGIIKGLGQAEREEEKHMLITEDGQMMPRDVEDRDRETEAFEAGEEFKEAVMESAEAAEEVMVKARRAPQEPSEAERLRHEATHIPYRSWCPYCVMGQGDSDPPKHHSGQHEILTIHVDYMYMKDDTRRK